MSTDLAATPLDKVGQLLGKTLRVKISDGRLVEGDLQCLDREMNLILISALEYYNYADISDNLETSKCRVLGMAMIPGNQVLSIHLKA